MLPNDPNVKYDYQNNKKNILDMKSTRIYECLQKAKMLEKDDMIVVSPKYSPAILIKNPFKNS
jgi:hypothetical protein